LEVISCIDGEWPREELTLSYIKSGERERESEREEIVCMEG